MAITIPRYYSGRREFLSASVQNSWQTALMTYYAIATRQAAFCRSIAPHNNDYAAADTSFKDGDTPLTAWSGYFIYTESGIAIRYAFTHYAYSTNAGDFTAHSEIRINGTPYVSKTAPANTAASYDDSFIVGGLNVGQVYKLELVSWLTTTESTAGILLVDPTHFSLTHSHTYQPIPTFAAAPIGADFSIANLNTIADALDGFGASLDLMPPVPTPASRDSRALDTYQYPMWSGTVIHAHNKLHITFYAGANAADKVTYKLYYGADVVSTAYLPQTHTSGLGYDTPLNELARFSIDVDISTYGHAIEDYVKIALTLTGANDFPIGVCEVQEVYTYTDTVPALPAAWTHGDEISFTKLNWYKQIFDSIDPAAAAPTTPLFFEQNAILTSENGFWLRHNRPYLNWIVDNADEDIVITLDGEIDPLKNIDPDPLKNVTPTNLATLDEMLLGTFYRVQNVLFAQEND